LREEESGVTRVGFVGAGRMGAPMVRRLVEAGHEVDVLGRTGEKRSAAAELGARPVADTAAVAEHAEAVVVCVFTDEQVKQVCLQGDLLAAMRPGTTLILHTTGSPRTAAAVADAAPHVDVVDAPVSGGPHDIAAGRVTLFVGGTDDAVTRVEPLLGAYGDPILHVGPAGSGQLVKLVNNTLFAAQIGLVAEGVRLGSALGLDEATLLQALTHGSASSRAVDNIARAGSAATFISAVGDFIGKDVAVVRKTVAELGGDLGILDDVVNAGLKG
jgi:3-hydroxyisobutyrate dehydrogenase-like beta-hydroxyacid dehydrogenase